MEEGFVVWLTGLPCCGKTTIARGLEEALRGNGIKVEVLDGDEVRTNLSKGAGFSREERGKHALRVAYVSRLLSRNNVATIVALISPYNSFRRHVRETVTNFVEVFVSCPVDVCIQRDVKGMYAKALAGEITEFTGVDDPYEEPENPEILINSDRESPGESVNRILGWLKDRNLIGDGVEAGARKAPIPGPTTR
jgi:adenylylsulfate kinase